MQGKDEEDYMKREGMIWGIKQEAHYNMTETHLLFFFFFTISHWFKKNKRPSKKNNAVTGLSASLSCVDSCECDDTLLTKLSNSGSSLKKGLCSRSCWCTKFSMSTSKLADVMHSDPCVACSHFSNSRASSGNNGCLRRQKEKKTITKKV